MADRLEPRSALDGLAGPGRSGRVEGDPGVLLAERTDMDLCVVLAARGQETGLRQALKREGFDLPAASRCAFARGLTLLWTGPAQWLAVGPPQAVRDFRRLVQGFETLCGLVPIEDARVVIGISGPRAREALAKLLPIDLHPRAFRPQHAAVTIAGAIPTIIWRLDDAGFEIAVPRSFAASFWHWLVDSAAEYGCVTNAPAGRQQADPALPSDVATQGRDR